MVSNTMTRTNAPGQGPARRPRQATIKLKKFPPVSPTVTDYDHAHHATYLRLLDADNEGADWQEVARVVLELDPIAAPETAKAIWERHLDRARWMSEQGYRQLIDS
jgi:Uncharacterized conserved protein (DUF2285)